jgi:pimeloyl-ACP methyl ester carboxylesterase
VPATAKPLVIFSHGNSFPAGTYNAVFKSLKARGFQVKAVDKFGHDPRYPVTSNWPHLVQQLADFTEREVEKSGQPAFLVGHSLGGFLSLMCAARNPQLGGQPVKGVVLVDSPILGGWRARALSVAKRAQLVGAISPGAISRKRRNQWLGKPTPCSSTSGAKKPSPPGTSRCCATTSSAAPMRRHRRRRRQAAC